MQKQLNFRDILLRHGKSVVKSRQECSIELELGPKQFICPVFSSNMASVLTQDICKQYDLSGWFYIYHRIDGQEDILNFVVRANREKWETVSISVGIKEEDVKLLGDIFAAGLRLDFITVDVALSFNDNIKRIIEIIKKLFPKTYLIVGNGATREWIEFLESIGGINAAKVGIGVSSSCRTRQFTGFGSTTVSSLIECVEAAKTLDIISDGGLTVEENGEIWIGDAAKALVLGAKAVMSGALFKNCVDSPSIIHGYYGNASIQAKGHNHHIEGETIKVVTNGRTIAEQMKLIEDSLKSSVSYSGGTTLEDLTRVKWSVIN